MSNSVSLLRGASYALSLVYMECQCFFTVTKYVIELFVTHCWVLFLLHCSAISTFNLIGKAIPPPPLPRQSFSDELAEMGLKVWEWKAVWKKHSGNYANLFPKIYSFAAIRKYSGSCRQRELRRRCWSYLPLWIRARVLPFMERILTQSKELFVGCDMLSLYDVIRPIFMGVCDCEDVATIWVLSDLYTSEIF